MRGDSKAAMAGGRGNVPGRRVLLPSILAALLLLVQSPAADAQTTLFQEFGSPASAPSSSPFSPPLPSRSSQTQSSVASPSPSPSPPPPPPVANPPATPAATAAPARSPPPPAATPAARLVSPPPPPPAAPDTTAVEAPSSSVNTTAVTGGVASGVSTPGTTTGTGNISTPGITSTTRTVPSPVQAPANTTSSPPPPQPAAPAPARTTSQSPPPPPSPSPPPAQQARAAAPVEGVTTPGVTASPPVAAPAPQATPVPTKTPTPPAPAPSVVVIPSTPSSSRPTPAQTAAAPASATARDSASPAPASPAAATTPAAATPLGIQPVAVDAPGPGEVFEAPVRGVGGISSASPLPAFSAASLAPGPAPSSSASATPVLAAPAPSARAASSPAPAVVLPQSTNPPTEAATVRVPAPAPSAAVTQAGGAAVPTPAPAAPELTIAPGAVPSMAPGPTSGSATLVPTVTPARAPAPVPASGVAEPAQVPTQAPATDTLAPVPAPAAAGVGAGVSSPGGAPSPSPADGAVGAFSVQAPAPGPGGVALTGPAPAPGPATTSEPLATAILASNSVGYAPSALAPDLETNLQFSPGPVAAAAPGLPDWLVGTQQIGTNLYYVGDGQNKGFYTVQTQSGTANVDTAFATVPPGSNVTAYSQLGIQTLLQGEMLFPFNETYQAALLNQLHIAFDQANVPHILQYQSATDLGDTQSSAPATGSTGRKLAQTNADNITNAVVSVRSQQNVQVNLTVAVPYQDRNNVSAIVDDAINSGQIRRGLQEAGLQVQNASVTSVNTIISGSNPNLTPVSASGTPAPSSGGSSVNGAAIGGAVGGGVAALAILAFIAWKVRSNRSKKRLELQASAAQKLEPSDAMAHVYTNNGRPGFIKTGVRKGSGDGALLTNGYSTTSSPIAQSVQPLSAHSGHSDPYQALLSVPDTPDWRPYRQFVGMGQQNYLNHIPGTEHLLDANVPQVIKSDLKMAKEIGKGSFGKVSIANWRGTTVAVKELKGNEEQGISPTAPEVLKALQKEASMMAAMRHPNVVLFLGICIESPSLITEYCARGSLYEVIQQWTRGKEVANWLRRLGMVLDAAKGMQYLHSCNPPIIHRDLKSPNLLVDKNYNVKICDFNLSKVMECTNSNVTSSLISVNPRWLAPEILKETGYSKASDVYSFGIVMWEMMTWQVPWKDLTTWQIMGMMSNRDNIPRPDIPDRLDCLPGGTFDGMADYVDLMKLCWAEDPAERPDFPKVAATLRHIMGREASLRRERSNRRNSSLGTDHASSAGLFSVGTQAATTDNDSSSDHSPHARPPKSDHSSAEASD